MFRIFFLSVFMVFATNGFSQARKNFEYNSKLYELHIDTPATKTLLKMCTPADDCKESESLLWPIDKPLFKAKFKELLTTFDSTNTEKAGLDKDQIADSMFAWLDKQFKPAPRTANDAAKEAFKKALNAEDHLKEIGYLFLNKDTASNGKKIESVQGNISDGVIARRTLFVTLVNGDIYFNQHYPISFPRYFKAKDRDLNLWKGSGTPTITLGSVMNYSPFGKIYYPEDHFILLDKDNDKDTLRLSTSLNNMLEINVYSDLLGVFGSKANGLIQTEISGHFISNTGSLRHLDLTFHHFMKPYLRLSRFDNQFKSMDSTRIVSKPNGDSLDRTYLSQVSYLQGGLKVNVARVNIGINQSFFLNIGAEVNLTNADSIYKKDIIFFNYYTELTYAIARLENFGMDAAIRYFWQHLSSDEVNGYKILNHKPVTFFSPTLSLFYHPFNNPNNRIYFRYTYMSNIKDKGGNYAQFQFGYKTAINLK